MEIRKALKQLREKGAMSELGQSVAKEAIKRAMLSQVGVLVPDFVINISKGELVPEALRGDPNIKFDSQFHAKESHCKAWCKVEDYCKCWGKCTDDKINPGIFERTTIAESIVTDFEALAKVQFNEEEIAELRTLGII